MADILFLNSKKKKDQVLLLPIDRILPNPAQPRTMFRQDELDKLSQSIQQNGILQPIIVRRLESGEYELVSGERRLRACKQLNFREIKALVIEVDDKQSAIFAMIENLQRSDLEFFDEARGIYDLIFQWGVTQEEAAQKLGMAQSTIANKIRLLRLEPSVQEAICAAGLTERHARSLLKLKEAELQKTAISVIEKKRLNVAQTEKYIDSLLQEKTKEAKKLLIVKDLRIFVNTINHAIDTMKQAGIEAEVGQRDEKEYIEYTVRIPKTSAYQQRRSNSA